MNSKRTFKRVAAGALAVLSVAGYAPANVGGILTQPTIVADAATVASLPIDAVNSYITAFDNGNGTILDTNAIQYMSNLPVVAGKTVTLKSSVPLTFTGQGSAYLKNGYIRVLKSESKNKPADELTANDYDYYKALNLGSNDVYNAYFDTSGYTDYYDENGKQLATKPSGKVVYTDKSANNNEKIGKVEALKKNDNGKYVLNDGYSVKVNPAEKKYYQPADYIDDSNVYFKDADSLYGPVANAKVKTTAYEGATAYTQIDGVKEATVGSSTEFFRKANKDNNYYIDEDATTDVVAEEAKYKKVNTSSDGGSPITEYTVVEGANATQIALRNAGTEDVNKKRYATDSDGNAYEANYKKLEGHDIANAFVDASNDVNESNFDSLKGSLYIKVTVNEDGYSNILIKKVQFDDIYVSDGYADDIYVSDGYANVKYVTLKENYKCELSEGDDVTVAYQPQDTDASIQFYGDVYLKKDADGKAFSTDGKKFTAVTADKVKCSSDLTKVETKTTVGENTTTTIDWYLKGNNDDGLSLVQNKYYVVTPETTVEGTTTPATAKLANFTKLTGVEVAYDYVYIISKTDLASNDFSKAVKVAGTTVDDTGEVVDITGEDAKTSTYVKLNEGYKANPADGKAGTTDETFLRELKIVSDNSNIGTNQVAVSKVNRIVYTLNENYAVITSNANGYDVETEAIKYDDYEDKNNYVTIQTYFNSIKSKLYATSDAGHATTTELSAETNNFTETVENGVYTYTFTMPETEVAINAIPQEIDVDIKGEAIKDSTGKITGYKKVSDDFKVYKDKDTTNPITLNKNDVPEIDNTIVNGNVTFTSSTYFDISYNDGSADTKVDVTYDKEDKKFKAVMTVPKHKEDKAVKVTIVEHPETYTFDASSGTHITMSSSAGAIKNAEVATISATYVKKDEDGKPVQENGKGVLVDATTAEVANGETVTVGYSIDDERLDLDSFKIKKPDGIISTYSTKKDFEENATKTFNAAGKYTLTLTVKPKGSNTSYEVSKTFSIASKDALTLKNVKLYLDDRDTRIDEHKELTLGSDGVFTYTAENANDFKSFKVTPEFYDNKGRILTGDGDYSLSGYTQGAKQDKVFSLDIEVTNPEYSKTGTLTVQWKVKSYTEPVTFTNDELRASANKGVSVSQDNINTLSDKIIKAVDINDKVDTTKISYEYVDGYGGARIDEDSLDERNEGLPKEAGQYSVYVLYDGEAKSVVEVNISAYTLELEVNSEDLNITYGDKLEVNGYTLRDAKQNEVTSVTAENIKVESIYEAEKVNGSYKAKAGATDKSGLDYLDAGTYIVKFTADSSDKENYAISGKEQVLVVAKKQITADMISITPFACDGTSKTVGDENVTFSDKVGDTINTNANGAVALEVLECPTASKVGTYTAVIGLADTNGKNANYTCGSDGVEVKWSITNAETKSSVNVGWNNDRTTLYNNGQIHLEVERMDNDNIKLNADGATVVKFGVIIDKNGKIPAPEKYNSPTNKEKAIAENSLKLNNGFTEGGYTLTTQFKADENTTYKVNVAVVNVETGIWAKPYMLLSDGTVAYGAVKYVDLTNEALNKLDVQLAGGSDYKSDGTTIDIDSWTTNGKRAADLTEAELEKIQAGKLKKTDKSVVNCGYNPAKNSFCAYATFNDLDNAGFGKDPEDTSKGVTVQGFGVVVDKSGILDAPTSASDTDAYANAKKQLVADKSKGFVVGNYKPGNSKLADNEYTALIGQVDSVTGIWVRAYIDLGNGLIVYSEPIYRSSVSDFYKVRKATSTPEIENNGSGDYKLKVKIPAVTAPTITGKTPEISEVGILVEKNNKFKEMTDAEMNKAFVIENKDKYGFLKGRKTSNFTTPYSIATSVTDINITNAYMRAYAIYKIDDSTSVTVYGDVVTALCKDGTGIPTKG